MNLSLGICILAAGASSRMGRPKLLLPWGETSILGHLLQQWTRLQATQIAVVCTHHTLAVQDELERLQFPAGDRILNPEPERGMFSSIQCAASWPHWKPDLTHWLVTLGDQPHVREDTLRALLGFAADHPEKICQPTRNGRRRHPVLLPRTGWIALRTTSASDLKAFLLSQAGILAGFEANDPGLDLDIDTPEDYERARRLLVL
jgi:molybdenum cofactor cytidylyltransferase